MFERESFVAEEKTEFERRKSKRQKKSVSVLELDRKRWAMRGITYAQESEIINPDECKRPEKLSQQNKVIGRTRRHQA